MRLQRNGIALLNMLMGKLKNETPRERLLIEKSGEGCDAKRSAQRKVTCRGRIRGSFTPRVTSPEVPISLEVWFFERMWFSEMICTVRMWGPMWGSWLTAGYAC